MRSFVPLLLGLAAVSVVADAKKTAKVTNVVYFDIEIDGEAVSQETRGS